MTLRDLVPILQVAIGPVILISGVGLLLLTMTNRFGRIIDRSRALAAERRRGGEADRPRIEAQLAILARRARLVQRAITLASLNALLAALLIILLFGTAVLALETPLLIAAVFSACLLCLIGSLVYFLRDINLSLEAVRREVGEVDHGG
jgi:hypothetical protein